MCGISGFIDPETGKGESISILSRMTHNIHHRGPDSEGFFVTRDVGIGVRRLSIIDVEGGHQPVANEDGRIIVVFNGEIYNSPSLRSDLIKRGHLFRSETDAEVIPHLYEEFGLEGSLQRMRGMFAFALYDTISRTLFLVRDRIGIKPLHYGIEGRVFAFGSEIKSILCHPSFKSPEIDRGAILRYLLFEYIPCPRTIYRGIYKLPPGHYLEYRDGDYRLKQYWDIPLSEEDESRENLDLSKKCEELDALLKESIALHLRSDVPLGTLLSGGIDSSIVTSIAREIIGKRLKTFSIGFTESPYDESIYFNEVAANLQTEHITKVLEEEESISILLKIAPFLDEPFADSSFVPTYFLASLVKSNGVVVVLSGDGGDELFAGYPTYLAHSLLPKRPLPFAVTEVVSTLANLFLPTSFGDVSFDYKVKRLIDGLPYPPPERNSVWLGAFLPTELRKLLIPDFFEGLDTHELDPFSEVRRYAEKVKGFPLLQQLQYLDIKLYLQDCILNKVDRASMLNSIEVRVPLLDHKVVEFAMKLPSKFKLNFKTTKFILKETFKKRLPPSVLHRKKKGFGLPTALYLKTSMKGMLIDLLKSRRNTLFNERYLNRLIDEHLKGRVNHRRRLYSLIIFRLWEEKGRIIK